MKRPIDPNLEDLTTEDFFLNAEKLDNDSDTKLSAMLDEKDESVPNFSVVEAEKTDNKDDYHAYNHSGSSHHSSESHHNHSSSSHSSHSHSGSSHHSSSSHHHSHHSSKKKKKPLALKIAIGILIFLLIVALAIVGTYIYLDQSGKSDLKSTTANFSYQETIEYNGKTYQYNEDVIAIAFLGIDERDMIEDATAGTAGQADADIVLTINTKTGYAKAIAIPRDTMVDVDLYSTSGIFLRTEKMQLCLSYAYGDGQETSAANTVTSISRILYNVPINKYFALDLNGIQPINDAIGGVTVTSLYDFDDLGIKEGDTVLLTGDLTEAYVRTRSLDNVEASLNRTARQVQYIKAFTAQLVPAIMDDFSVVSKLYNTASEYSSTDITLSNATYLASLLLSKGVTEFDTVTLEGTMEMSDNVENSDVVYAEFTPDEDALMEVVLSTFYTEITE